MSNGGDDEPDVAGRGYNVGASMGLNLGDFDKAASQVQNLTSQITQLQKALTSLSGQSGQISRNISGMINTIGTGGGGGGGAGGGGGGGGGGSYANGGVSAGRSMMNFASSMFGTVNQNGWMRDLMLFPTRFMNTQIQNNRDIAMAGSSSLGMQAFGSGATTANMMGALGKNFGNVMGSPADLLNLMQAAGQSGAGIDWRGYTGMSIGGGAQGPANTQNGPRAGGFMTAVRQAQLMNPGADVSQLAGSIGGYAGNVGAQQMGTFLTGGAFSMISAGNQQKSISQWADGILKFLQNQRPGGDRGKPFSYGELITQNFPGSNIDQWLSVNGVPPDMKGYFWSYAMGKASAAPGQDIFATSGPGANPAIQQSVSYQRLAAANAQTRTGFTLAGKLSDQYANKEQANRWFNELMGQMMQQILPSALSSGALSFMQFLPDAIQDMMMQLSERTSVGALGAGALGWGSLFGGGGGLMDSLGNVGGLISGALSGGITGGDVGDVGGGFGSMGATTSAGMHPDMRKRVNAMMRANPNLQINSGFRDLGTQQRLKRKGVGRVSGRPSAHTRGMAADIGPSSQYPWLVANARKFGLKSGVGAGEPWHVGMGDPDGVGDSSGLIAQLLGPLLGGFGNLFMGGQEDQIASVAGGTTGILKLLMAMFGGKDVDESKMGFTDVYEQLAAATGAALQKGISSIAAPAGAPGATGAIPAPSNVQTGVPASPSGGKGNVLSFDTGNWLSSDAVTRARATAQAAYAGGWRGEDLFKILSIAGRETNWHNTHAYVPSTGDDSWGLTMINMLGKLGPSNRTLFGITSNQELLNPYTSMVASKKIHDQTNKYGGFFAWGPYKGRNELYDTEDYEQGVAKQALAAEFPQGYGDTDAAMTYAIPAPNRGTGGVNFYNTFSINGSGGGGANGGIDVRRTATLLADQLEEQMKQRMARMN